MAEANQYPFMVPEKIKEHRNTNIYEVVIYNTEVRRYVEFDEKHPRYDDGWADSRYIELPALNIRSAIRKIRSKYPRSRGFKITAITQIPEFTVDKRERF
jgi:inner membrane protein involved in colicin E2 resistance